MGKPRATRKQPIVLSSDDDEDALYSPPPKRPKRGTLMSIAQNGARGDSKSKPTKQVKSPSKSPSKPKPIYRPITSFFSNIPPPQTAQPTPSPERAAASTPVEDDDILDSSADERSVKSGLEKTEAATALAVRKRGNDQRITETEGLPKASQRFLRTTNGKRSTPPLSQQVRAENVDTRPWNEKYGPISLDELAVHKKKVSDVQKWLSDVYSGRERKRLLLLKGSAGSGKTTTISLLSKGMGIDIQEWKNPIGSTLSSEGFASVTAQFEDFVGRTGAFGSLAFDEPASTRPAQPTPSTPSRQKQLILVEEFPNTFTRGSSAVQSFRASVLNFLAASTPSATTFFSRQTDSDEPVTPIVMIISETLLSTNTAAADSFTAHRLLGPEILTHPGVSVIDFNPIAPTYMAKALELIVQKEARKSGRRKTAGPQVIQRLSELGDIRSAVSSLEFLCLRGDEDEGWGAKVNFSKKKGCKDVALTKMEKESLEMVTQRESTLGIFHAVGRVVYNKRLPEDSTVAQPPNWFPERRRPKPSEVNVDMLIDELGTDTQTFIAALHENYVLSCGGDDSEEAMDSINGCIDALSDADLLSTDRFGSGHNRRNFQGTSQDNLRQEEMCFQVSVRGLLYNLPSPVKRVSPPPGVMGIKGKATGKGSAFAMYYPSSLRLWRQQEEIGELLDMWISKAQRGELFNTSVGLTKNPDTRTSGVDTWRKTATPTPARSSVPSSTHSASAKAVIEDDTDTPPILIGSGGSARYEMLLERLPYLPLLLRNRKSSMPSPATVATIREIQKITSFSGTTVTASVDVDDDQDEDDEVPEVEQWATDNPGSGTSRRRKGKFGMGIKKKSDGDGEERMMSAVPGIGVENDVAGMVLNDDDIED
ncbi:Rad17 cell cycle checkpoint protein-domain-containing protein [Clohesyomyces aquaticus]|uniref:Rad17 cell cycle checkpoint protein-domain-containing protein n=1 Tax=Clohesyomyces aquaticus TaxID=1231657 RepID=A0A1Y1YR85_9PLEO|nr:Rad17 cell cycle checkpoint protein-domain-containing protein [Clohesyomyces aquaticus]